MQKSVLEGQDFVVPRAPRNHAKPYDSLKKSMCVTRFLVVMVKTLVKC